MNGYILGGSLKASKLKQIFFPFYSQNQFQQDQRGQEEDLGNG